MFPLRSAIDSFPARVDVRYLTMEGEYYCFSDAEANSFLLSFLVFIKDFAGEQCLYFWSTMPRCPRFEKDPMKLLCGNDILFAAEGVVRGETIANKADFRKWSRELYYPSTPQQEQTIPDDYAIYFQDILDVVNVGEKSWSEALLDLFSLPGKIPMLPFRRSEVGVYAEKIDSIFELDKKDGEFSFAVPLYCLNQSVDSAAEEMASFLRRTAEKLPTLNARVMISEPPSISKASAYMTYFGDTTIEFNQRIPKGVPSRSWTYTNYLCGAEWFNIVSPIARGKLPFLEEEKERYSDICVECLPNGCAVVYYKGAISDFGLKDLFGMKQLLYDALVPGESHLYPLKFADFHSGLDNYQTKPRMLWENVSISGDEITAEGDVITIKHR